MEWQRSFTAKHEEVGRETSRGVNTDASVSSTKSLLKSGYWETDVVRIAVRNAPKAC